MVITVKKLMIKPFRSRSTESKIRIVSEGKPRPLLQILAVSDKDGADMNKTKEFDPVVYDKIHWLTRCEIRKKFYCWSCLLFYGSKVEQLYDTEMASNLKKFALLHESTDRHKQATMYYEGFVSNHLMEKPANLNVRAIENYKIVKLLIETVCTVAENHPFPENNSFHALVSAEVYDKIINPLNIGHDTSNKYVEDAIKLIKKYPTLLDDIVCSITQAFKLVVIKEVKMSTYASLILSTHYSSSTLKSQLSVVLRYINEGKVYERFLGFETISTVESVNVVYNIIKRALETFEIQDKFLSYSFDGSVLEISKLIQLNDLLQINYPQSYFVPYYFQSIPHIIQQSLSFDKVIEQFFDILIDMEDYFQESSDPRKVFENIVFKKGNQNSFFNSPFIYCVYVYRKHFIETLKFISGGYTLCNAENVTKANFFLQFLVELRTVYLIHILSPSFKRIIDFESNIRNSSHEMEFRSEIAYDTIICDIQNEENSSIYFNHAIEDLNSANNDGYESNQVKANYNSDQWIKYSSMYITIIDHLVKEIKLRFSNLDDIAFCSLFNSYKINISQKRSIYCYSKLDSTPKLNFSSQKLGIELFYQIEKKIFENKNAYDLLHFYEKTNCKTVFPCTNNLLEFSLTMPFRPLWHDENLPKFRKIKKCASHPESNIKHCDASILFIESKSLRNFKTDSSFCNDVFEKLSEVDISVVTEDHKTYEPSYINGASLQEPSLEFENYQNRLYNLRSN